MCFSTPAFGLSPLPISPLSYGIKTLATGTMSGMIWEMSLKYPRPPIETISCRGGRSGFLVRWVRGWWLWKYYAGLENGILSKSGNTLLRYCWEIELLYFINITLLTLCNTDFFPVKIVKTVDLPPEKRWKSWSSTNIIMIMIIWHCRGER